MSSNPRMEAEKFLQIADQFKLGELVTELSHPVTRDLSCTASESISDAIRLLLEVDKDLISVYRSCKDSGLLQSVSNTAADALKSGGRIFFTGCGATGRLSIQLDSIWRRFWRQYKGAESEIYRDRTISIMAGGDYALIKSVEGFEDFTQFGRKQIADMGVSSSDIVFAITEGGETSFVIGTAWQGLDAGAKVYFVYNNPDHLLCEYVERSREIIQNPQINKINLTTGPMAIMGSTRMQATSIQLCVMITILEMTICNITGADNPSSIPACFLNQLEDAYKTITSTEIINSLEKLVSIEADVYSKGKKTSYFADGFGVDVLTDTTERSPTFCTPAFRKFDDSNASESWAFLFAPYETTSEAWANLLERPVRCLDWSDDEISLLVPADVSGRQCEIMRQISYDEIHKFKIGMDGMQYRPMNIGDAMYFVLSEDDAANIDKFSNLMKTAQKDGTSNSIIYVGNKASGDQIKSSLHAADIRYQGVFIHADDSFFLKGILHIIVKMVLNTMSTCIMVRLGRVMGNCMTSVVPSNLKLIDRSIRYIQILTGISYEDACCKLFESIEYIKPRMLSGSTYPPPVKLNVISINSGISLQQAESIIFKNS